MNEDSNIPVPHGREEFSALEPSTATGEGEKRPWHEPTIRVLDVSPRTASGTNVYLHENAYSRPRS